MSGSGRRGQCLAAIVVVIVADIDDACGRGTGGSHRESPSGIQANGRPNFRLIKTVKNFQHDRDSLAVFIDLLTKCITERWR